MAIGVIGHAELLFALIGGVVGVWFGGGSLSLGSLLALLRWWASLFATAS